MKGTAKENEQTERKYVQIIHLTEDLHPEYEKVLAKLIKKTNNPIKMDKKFGKTLLQGRSTKPYDVYNGML